MLDSPERHTDALLLATSRRRGPALDPTVRPMPQFLIDGPDDAATTILLAHGAGSPMDSPSMTTITTALTAAGLRVARFEFDYMAARRTGARKSCPRGESLKPEYLAAVDALPVRGHLVIGGKSLGGRVASMVADPLFAIGDIAGLLCLGYPFHPVGKPDQLRTAHLAALRTPTLIVQGTRDPFGTPAEVSTYALADTIDIAWLDDADHDLRSRKAVTGRSADETLAVLASQVASWAAALD